MIKYLTVTITIIMICLPIYADVSSDRMNRTMNVFASGMDKLLLDTPHVYVTLSDHVGSFYLDGSGAFFIGNISITATASISVYLNDWNKFFSGIEVSRENLKALRDQAMTHQDSSEENPDLEELNKELEELDKELEKKKLKERSIKEEDARRKEEMGSHISAFKKELIQTIMDFGPVLKGVDKNEKIVVVFFVKDKIFLERYNANYLMVSVEWGRLMELLDMSSDDPAILKAFKFNM